LRYSKETKKKTWVSAKIGHGGQGKEGSCLKLLLEGAATAEVNDRGRRMLHSVSRPEGRGRLGVKRGQAGKGGVIGTGRGASLAGITSTSFPGAERELDFRSKKNWSPAKCRE